ncbi:hypothetical protein, partial [Klebsiella pneumoniae]|uniref:hypothetical protein n=1 Tax=Klebsiella pneumoniae TaxID=573 RepID=UPI002731DA85
VVLAPSAAIQFGNNGTFVYKLDGDKKVKVQPWRRCQCTTWTTACGSASGWIVNSRSLPR